METLVGTLLGTLGVALITGVLAYSREQNTKTREAADKQVENAREDTKWYRDRLLPMLERQQDIMEGMRGEILDLARAQGQGTPSQQRTNYKAGHDGPS